MSVTSQEKEKAEEMVKDFDNEIIDAMMEHGPDGHIDGHFIIAKICTSKCVDKIIEALETTTGHCELRSLDRHEVQNDFEFWKQVKIEIENYEE